MTFKTLTKKIQDPSKKGLLKIKAKLSLLSTKAIFRTNNIRVFKREKNQVIKPFK